MPPAGNEPTSSAGERPQTYALECAATGTDVAFDKEVKNKDRYWIVELI